MGVHNQTASMANLARAQLQALDRSQINTVVVTATYELLLKTLIELAEPQAAIDAGNRALRTHLSTMSQFQNGGAKGGA